MPEVEIKMDDGSIARTELPPDEVADLQPKPDAQPEAKEPEAKPEPPAKPAEPKAEEKADKPDPEPGPKTKKASPIANLLAKKNEVEQQLETERKANAEKIAGLEAKLDALSKQPASAASDDEVKQLAKKFDLNEEILREIVTAARAGIKTPEIPAEVQQLIAERQQQQAIDAELAAFDADVDSLAKTFKDEPLSDPKVRQKLMELAYSEEQAPDGQPFDQKPLHELYFNHIKPEIEPGQPSAEPSRGGTKSGATVIDFQEIADRDDPKDIESMDDATFEKFTKWQREKAGQPPIKRPHSH